MFRIRKIGHELCEGCQKQYFNKQNEIVRCHRRATYKQYNTFQGVWIYMCGLHKYKKSLWAKIK